MLKQPPAPDTGLLDYLEQQTHAAYLSDLHAPEFIEPLYTLLDQIPAEWFSEKEWADAARYLIQTAQDGKAAEDSKTIRRTLLSYLSQSIQGN